MSENDELFIPRVEINRNYTTRMWIITFGAPATARCSITQHNPDGVLAITKFIEFVVSKARGSTEFSRFAETKREPNTRSVVSFQFATREETTRFAELLDGGGFSGKDVVMPDPR